MAEKSIDILSPRLIGLVKQLIKEAEAARPSLSPDQRRKRPVGEGGGTNNPEELVGIITRVTNKSDGQPKYNARGVRSPDVTVTNQTPFYRDTDSSVFINASIVGDECELFRDADEVWRLGKTHEFMATADCQAVAGSRNNRSISIITTTPISTLPITSDNVLVDTTDADVTITLPEDETGKPIAVTNIGETGNKVTITNEFYGTAGMDIIFFKTTLDCVYTGVPATKWILT